METWEDSTTIRFLAGMKCNWEFQNYTAVIQKAKDFYEI
jgi:hypothetical protein